MPDTPKIIAPSPLSPAPGLNLTVAFDVDPETFPDGVEFVVMLPGKLEPIGKLQVARGHTLCALPLDMSANLRAQFKAAFAEHQKKQAQAAN